MTLPAGVATLIAGCLLGWYGRYFVVEPDQLGALCVAAAPPDWCAARTVFIDITFGGTYGVVAVAAAVLVWVLRGRAATVIAVIGLVAGGLGLYLYDTAWAASGVLGILLRLPRIGEELADPREFSA